MVLLPVRLVPMVVVPMVEVPMVVVPMVVVPVVSVPVVSVPVVSVPVVSVPVVSEPVVSDPVVSDPVVSVPMVSVPVVEESAPASTLDPESSSSEHPAASRATSKNGNRYTDRRTRSSLGRPRNGFRGPGRSLIARRQFSSRQVPAASLVAADSLHKEEH